MGEVLLAIDPGRRKCGLVILSRDCDILERSVVLTARLGEELARLAGVYHPDAILLGSGTNSRKLRSELERHLPGVPLRVVDERNTTFEARRKFLAAHPARGLWKLLPEGLRTPDQPYDDYAALVLAEKYLAAKRQLRRAGKESQDQLRLFPGNEQEMRGEPA